KEIKSGDDYGVFEVTDLANDKINLTNKNTVSLSRNTETTLMGNMKFKIADSNTLRFYPKVDYVIGTGGDVTTGTGATATATTTVKGNVTQTLTATPTEVKTQETPAAATTTGETGKPATTTPTEPGFEAVFAIAGLLAVAFLVLRQRK
ncbi:MAG: PGF-CTERM sorting domain-containing protein, partial [Candidatus Methanoperedens sp.]|nr:PGF-CTERM sorting domain-containing protein [Candidatus Methanoperedens sp.]